jgi:hypothetical protein
MDMKRAETLKPFMSNTFATIRLMPFLTVKLCGSRQPQMPIDNLCSVRTNGLSAHHTKSYLNNIVRLKVDSTYQRIDGYLHEFHLQSY